MIPETGLLRSLINFSWLAHAHFLKCPRANQTNNVLLFFFRPNLW